VAWLFQPTSSQAVLASRFRALMAGPAIVKIPGAYDALSALTAKAVGFDALYLSGAAYTASRGLPDLGVVGAPEVAERARDLVRATDLPLLVDIDTGFGGVVQAAVTARAMAEARVAAVQIEDQELPKKCGHLTGKSLVAPEEMAAKIRAMREVAPDLVIVARTDAYANEGLAGVVRRAQRYLEAGADAIFPEALDTEEAFRAVAKAIRAPLLANMTEFGQTPYFTAEQFETFGYRMVIYPVSALRVAAKAYQRLYQTILETGTQQPFLDAMQTRRELYDLIRYWDYEALDARIAKSVLPDDRRRDDPGGA
jgi:methylisocitrate lyase